CGSRAASSGARSRHDEADRAGDHLDLRVAAVPRELLAVDLRGERHAGGGGEGEAGARGLERAGVLDPDLVPDLFVERISVEIDDRLRGPVELSAEGNDLEEAVVVAGGAVEDPGAAVDPRRFHDEIGEALEDARLGFAGDFDQGGELVGGDV